MPLWMVTGGSGFLGRHVMAAVGPGIDLVAIGRQPREVAGSFVKADLDDEVGLKQVIGRVAPDVVIHLAGRTPPASHESLYRSNVLGTLHLLDAVRSLDRSVRVVLAGSAAELGPVAVEDLPVGADYPCRPLEGYGLSKWLATCAGLASRPPVEVVVGRIFNPIGPGTPTSQAFGRFAEALKTGKGPTRLTVGDLDARRDFVDVRDVAAAMVALAERGHSGQVYLIGTGRSHSVGEGLDRLIAMSGRAVTVDADPGLARARGPSDSRADVTKIAREVGWSAAIPWEQSLRDLWDAAVGLTDREPSV